MNRIYTLAATLLLCLCTFQLNAQRIYVRSGGTGNGSSWAQASGDLSSALATAIPGTEIWVAAGTYYPTTCSPCSNSDQRIYFEIPDQVAIYGGFTGTETQRNQRDWTANRCILSGDIDQDGTLSNNAFTILYTHDVSPTTLLDGFTIQHGNAVDLSAPYGAPPNTGGGWYNDGSQATNISNPTIRNCTFRWNHAVGFGGGMYNDGCFTGEGNPLLVNCTFWQNQANEGGGGMYNNGSFDGDCSPTYVNCNFQDNFSQNSGGGLFNNGLSGNSGPIINNSTFSENRVDLYGAGIYNLGNEGNCSPWLTNCTFFSNQALAAACIYNIGSDQGNSSPVITNCTFYGNQADVGVCVYNQAVDSTGNANPIVTNSIFWGNIANSGFGYVFQNVYGEPTISYSLVQVDNCTELNTGLNGSVQCGSNMIFNDDPMLVDPANNDFHLSLSSPGIDQGDNMAINATGLTVDLDSLLRISNGQVDLGAYEYAQVAYVAPVISGQPQAQRVCEGTALQFEVMVEGSRPLSYQWQKDNVDIPGATDSIWVISSAVVADVGAYRCRVTGAQQEVVFSAGAALEVDAFLEVALSIEATDTSICRGQMVTFRAHVTNAGSSPIYQWQLNGQVIGSNQDSLSIDSLKNGDELTCILQSSIPCPEQAMVQAEAITVSVQDYAAPTISITTTEARICDGELVTFNATATDGGSDPIYTWLIGLNQTGGNTPSFSTDQLQDGDEVWCVLNSSLECLNVNQVPSNRIVMEVDTFVMATVDIVADTTQLCAGEAAAVEALPTNGGTNPYYRWYLNGALASFDRAIFTSDQLVDGEELYCEMLSSESCVLESTVTSDTLTFSIDSLLEVSVQIEIPDTMICPGDTITFTAIAANGGDFPVFQWQLNGQVVGDSSGIFITDTLEEGDRIQCLLSSSLSCVVEDSVASNAINISMDNCMVATDDINLNVHLKLFPNPSKGQFTLSTQGLHGEFELQIVALDGTLIQQTEVYLSGDNDLQNINLSGYGAGVYFVKLYNEKHHFMRRAVRLR
ncbi:MAG: T9SS type A sorting domain-containing protein [Bacteroidota bacterium]